MQDVKGIDFLQTKEILSEYVKKNKLNFKSLHLTKRRLESLRRIIFVGVGGGYASALVGASTFERLTDCLISVYPAGEFRYSPTVVDKNTLLIAVSKTGAEEDIIASVKRVRSIGGRAIVVCSSKESTAAKNANYVLNPVADSFENECFVLTLLALYVGNKYGFVTKMYKSVAIKFAEMLNCGSSNNAVAEWLNDGGEMITCGRGADYGVALDLAFQKGVNATACYISQLPLMNLENKKILAIVSSKDFINDIMFYLDIAKQRGERLLVLTTDDVAEIMPKTSNIVSFHGSLPIYNPIVVSNGLNLFLPSVENRT